MTKGFTGFLRDNLEAFAVAIAMALVIRHFCIEAFRIPTNSMKPTLLGDEPPNGGDRILVDKIGWMLREPRRYEVAVFQFPLNRSKNYIKRLVGLPGEWLRAVDGDIWTSRDEGATWTIARKPPGIRDQLLFPYYPEPRGDVGVLPARGNWEADDGWLADEATERFDVDADDAKAELRFERRVVPFGIDRGHVPVVGDVRVSFDLAVERAGTITVRIQEHGRPHRLVLGREESYAVAVTDAGEQRVPLEVRLRDGGEYAVSFANVDDTLVVEIDGDAEATLEMPFQDAAGGPSTPPRIETAPPWWDHAIALEAAGLKATLEAIRIDRDIYYNPQTYQPGESPDDIWRIPEGHYFMMGDNTASSLDSRKWASATVRLKDGTEIRWHESADDVRNPPAHAIEPGSEESYTIEKDVDGLVRRFRGLDVAGEPTSVPNPFVPRDHLVGRAFAIFWPIHIPRLVRGPTRIDLIR